MAYVKPGVEVTQVQTTASPSNIAPDLTAVIIGKPYYIEETGDYSYGTYSGIQVIVTPMQLPSGAELHDDSVYVDLIGGTGASSGTRLHLVKDTDFTVSSNDVTINANLEASYPSIVGLDTASEIEMGFRAQRVDVATYLEIESLQDIRDYVGEPKSYNPLGMGALLALSNTGTAVALQPVNEATPVPATNEMVYTDVDFDILSVKEVYAMAAMSHGSSLDSTMLTHANAMSLPTEKKERFVIWNEPIDWVDGGGTGTTKGAADVNLVNTAGQVKEYSVGNGDRRFISVFPDICYVAEKRHVSTLATTYIAAVQGAGASDELVYLSQAYSVTVSDTVYTYRKGQELTAAILANLSTGFTYLNVEVPVPGYMATAVIAGMVSGNAPEQPFTNLAVAGITRVKYATDRFTETHLNTMAEGGTYILTQSSAAAPIYCRHQLTTDVTSIERQELSILKALDFTSKFIRNGLTGYIGKYNIDDNFLSLLNMTLQSQIIFLVRLGAVRDITVVSMAQSETQPDSVDVVLDVLVKYPVNYIRITLQF